MQPHMQLQEDKDFETILVREVGFEPTNLCRIGASGLRLWPCWATPALGRTNQFFLCRGCYMANNRNRQHIKRFYFAFLPKRVQISLLWRKLQWLCEKKAISIYNAVLNITAL
jgi:hypothetical protein